MTYNFPAQIYYFDCESGCGNVWKKHQTDQLPVQRTADGENHREKHAADNQSYIFRLQGICKDMEHVSEQRIKKEHA